MQSSISIERPVQTLGATAAGHPLRVLEVVSRLVGGAAAQAVQLTAALCERGNDARLAHGRAEPDEPTVEDLVRETNLLSEVVPGMRRRLGPGDVRALAALRSLVRHARPLVVHTHAAKGGTLGRVAALGAGMARPPVLVHTFHGHVLHSYFGSAQSAAYRRVETALARRTTQIITVASETRDELVRLGIAPRERIAVIPPGVDFAPFNRPREESRRERERIRGELGIAPAAPVVTTIARLAPIKRIDRYLRSAARVAEDVKDARFVVVGDGPVGASLRQSAEAKRLGDRLIWTGQRADVASLCFASDVVVSTSDSEGTPTSLIEAQAARVPVVATKVGGVLQVVDQGRSGWLVRSDAGEVADAVLALVGDPELRRRFGERGRERVLARYGLDRMVADTEALYRELLEVAGGR